MNRVIKFRAWDGEKMHHFDLSDTIAPSLEDNIMQFTGLQDANGVDIYEGDIIGTSMYSGYKYEVRFENAAFYLYHYKSLKQIDGIPMKWGLFSRFFEVIDFKYEAQVISNIYEN
jgi:uncharacterized phage protein (TIGR01671 family)